MKRVVSTACESLCRDSDVSILAFHMLRVLEDLGLVDQTKDRHAGEWETSLILSICSEVVGDVDVYSNIEEIKRSGVFGDPREASNASGKEHLERLIRHIEDDITESGFLGFHCNWQVSL